MTARCLVVTIDTEVDKGPDWRVSDPARFRSVVEGVPRVFSPLFDRYGVRPTYLLSAEVIEEPECVAVLGALGGRAELGTHLHGEFVEPGRRLGPSNMAGAAADAVQCRDPRDVEAAKLANLTRAFREAFGYAPTSFRAGRYGSGPHTLEILAGLGYLVDSSVTPGLLWDYPEGRVDHRAWVPGPRWVETPSGRILEVPLSIRPGGAPARWLRDGPRWLRRAGGRALGRRGAYQWLRPSWCSGAELVRYVESSGEAVLNLMLHSMEVIPGASPYAQTEGEAARIVGTMGELFAYCARAGFTFCGLSEAARRA